MMISSNAKRDCWDSACILVLNWNNEAQKNWNLWINSWCISFSFCENTDDMHINLWHKTEPFHYHSHEVYLSPYIFFYLFLYRWKNWESNHTKTLYKQKTLTSSHTSQFQLFPLTSWSGHDFIISLFPPTTQL
jgi:hypothetical protein